MLFSKRGLMMKNQLRMTVIHPAIIFPTRRRLGWRAATLALIAVCQLPTSVVWATINAGTTTVTSIGHSFEPENPTSGTGHPAVVTDFLVNQTQEVGGGAVLPAVTVNLDSDTSISYTIAAPAGKKFVIQLPTGSSANMSLSLAWQTGAFDFGNSAAFNASFQDLVGVAPSFPSGSIVGTNDQAFDFASLTPVFSNDLSFTSVTFTTTYDPRTLGQGPLTYQPAGSIRPSEQPPGTQTSPLATPRPAQSIRGASYRWCLWCPATTTATAPWMPATTRCGAIRLVRPPISLLTATATA